jgi:hypothetical protein
MIRVGGAEMEQDVNLITEASKPVGIADVEFRQFHAGKRCNRRIAAGIGERADRGDDIVAPFGKGANKVVADMAIRLCNQNLHDRARITVSAAGANIEMKISLQVKQS